MIHQKCTNLIHQWQWDVLTINFVQQTYPIYTYGTLTEVRRFVQHTTVESSARKRSIFLQHHKLQHWNIVNYKAACG